MLSEISQSQKNITQFHLYEVSKIVHSRKQSTENVSQGLGGGGNGGFANQWA